MGEEKVRHVGSGEEEMPEGSLGILGVGGG